MHFLLFSFFFFFNDTATTEIYTLSLHDALPISGDLTRDVGGERLGSGRLGRSPLRAQLGSAEIGRAHVCTPVTRPSRMPSSAWKKKKINDKQRQPCQNRYRRANR